MGQPPAARSWPRARRLGLVGLVACAASAISLGGRGSAQVDGPAVVPAAANVVLITTDDQALNSFTREAMPRTFATLRKRGTAFANSFATPPLCCPARAAWITGQYPHNHGVFSNEPGYRDLADPANVLPAWLDGAGYRTGFVGKYLNGTRETLGLTPPPGWDRWFGLLRADYADPLVSVDGERRRYPGRYVTRLLSAQGLRFVRESAEGEAPFFLWLSQLAPHGEGAGSSRRCPRPSPQAPGKAYHRFAGSRLPMGPGFDERNVADKPAYVRRRPPLSDGTMRRLRKRYRCTLAAVRVVDEGVGEIVGALKRLGIYDTTAVIFTSDNGYMLGEHRLPSGKAKPYEESLRVPLSAHIPRPALGGEAVERVQEPVGSIDLAPTVLDLAGGARPCSQLLECRTMDGRSLLDLAAGERSGWPGDRGLLMEVEGPCHQRAIRTTRYMLATSNPGCRPRNFELYDLWRDPFELRSLGHSRPGLESRLRERLDALKHCAGVTGRDAPLAGEATYCE